ncbi:MAG: C40 family peptidase [Chitinophagaceae bacterium]|nr:C40 family peptidase [Chitinophagaceae bacterium]
MHYAIPIVAVCAMRLQASHRSEMVSQLLMGEPAVVVETETDFLKVQSLYDRYEGWCQKSQLAVLKELPTYHQTSWMSKDHTSIVMVDDTPVYISAGTPLQYLHDHKWGGYSFRYVGNFWDTQNAVFDEKTILGLTELYLNTPYLWGGRSVMGIDCSGFSQQVYRFFGKSLPRDAYQQAALGESVGFLQETRCGDLAFFDNAEGKITHVGIILSSDKIIHASGQVRIDSIDNMGIIHSKTGMRTHNLRIIKRYR